jgi:hypothetical protein
MPSARAGCRWSGRYSCEAFIARFRFLVSVSCHIEEYLAQYRSGAMVAAWRDAVAYVAPHHGKYCLYSLRERREVRCIDLYSTDCTAYATYSEPHGIVLRDIESDRPVAVVRPGETVPLARLGACPWGLPVWHAVSGSAVEALFLVAFGGRVMAYRLVARPSDISAERAAEVSAGSAFTWSVLDSTFTWPRMWVLDGVDKNCVWRVDFERGTAARIGCYGPAGYNIWPMVAWDKETDLGRGRWLLASHHYWIVGAFSYLHVIDRERGQPARSYTDHDSCSGSFSAHDKLVGGPWHGLDIAWGRSGGIGSRSCIHVFRKPFSDRAALFTGPAPDNPKALLPLLASPDGYVVLEIHEEYGVRCYARILKMDPSGLAPLADVGAAAWQDHENVAHYYDAVTGELAAAWLASGKLHLLRCRLSGGSPAACTSRSLPRYALGQAGSVSILAAGRLAGCEPESQCEHVAGAPPGAPVPASRSALAAAAAGIAAFITAARG